MNSKRQKVISAVDKSLNFNHNKKTLDNECLCLDQIIFFKNNTFVSKKYIETTIFDFCSEIEFLRHTTLHNLFDKI